MHGRSACTQGVLTSRAAIVNQLPVTIPRFSAAPSMVSARLLTSVLFICLTGFFISPLSPRICLFGSETFQKSKVCRSAPQVGVALVCVHTHSVRVKHVTHSSAWQRANEFLSQAATHTPHTHTDIHTHTTRTTHTHHTYHTHNSLQINF